MLPDVFSLEGRAALVTGGNSGIGLTLALALREAGAKVAIGGRRADRNAAALSKLGGDGKSAVAVDLDVCDETSVERAIAAIVERFGRIDILVNNAGDVNRKSVMELERTDWDRVMAINLTGPFLCTKHAARHMKQQGGGKIINIASVYGLTAPSKGLQVAYTASKHGVTGLTRSISLDGREFDICAGQIDIGNAATPLTARSTAGQMQPHGQLMQEARMDVNHVGQQILFMSNLPLESNVQFVTIMATKMPFIGRG